jgi:hypothetical protein
MQCWIRTALAGLLVAACGSEAPQSSAAQGDKPRKDASGIDACALVTAEDIEGAAGWKPEATDPETHQRTATCTYHRADGAKIQTIVLIVSPAGGLGQGPAAGGEGLQPGGVEDPGRQGDRATTLIRLSGPPVRSPPRGAPKRRAPASDFRPLPPERR